MSTLLSPAEFWVLSHAVEWRMPLGIYGAGNFGEIMNCNAPRFTIEDVSRAITSLFERQLIAVGPRSGDSCIEEHLIGLEAKLREHAPFVSYLWLTPSGGAAWEEYVRPDWGNFVLEDKDNEGHVLSITCQRPHLIQWYRRALQEALGADRLPVIEEPVESWPATYWKTLLGGQRLRFSKEAQQGRVPSIGSNGQWAMTHLVHLWRKVGTA